MIRKLLILTFYTTICLTSYSQKAISAFEMQKCVGEFSTNIEAILLINGFVFAKFDSTSNMVSYSYSETVGPRDNGIRFCNVWRKNDTASTISYSTIVKQEYFKWLTDLKIMKYKIEKPSYTLETKEEWFYNNLYGVRIITAPTETVEKKERINLYTFTIVRRKNNSSK